MNIVDLTKKVSNIVDTQGLGKAKEYIKSTNNTTKQVILPKIVTPKVVTPTIKTISPISLNNVMANTKVKDMVNTLKVIPNLQQKVSEGQKAETKERASQLGKDLYTSWGNLGTNILLSGLQGTRYVTSAINKVLPKAVDILDLKINNKEDKDKVDLSKLFINNTLGKVSNLAQDSISRIEGQNTAEQEQIKTPFIKTANKYANIIGQQVPTIASYALSPLLGATIGGINAAGAYQVDAEKRGATEKQALTQGTILGIAEGLSEKLTLGALGKGVTSIAKGAITKGLTSTAIGIAENALQEAVMEPIQEATSQAVIGKSDWTGIGKRMLNSGIDGAIAYLILGGAADGLASATNITSKVADGKTVTQSEITKAVSEIKNNTAVTDTDIIDTSNKIKEIQNTITQNKTAVPQTTVIPKTVYHGSANTNLTSKDINVPNINTNSGENGIMWFSDNKDFSKDFAQELKPSNKSSFLMEKGKQGKIYESNININNPLDLTNLTDKMINDIISISPDKVSREQIIRDYNSQNGQLLKTYLPTNYQELKKLGYDGVIAWANKANNVKEYGVLNSNQIQLKSDQNLIPTSQNKATLPSNTITALDKITGTNNIKTSGRGKSKFLENIQTSKLIDDTAKASLTNKDAYKLETTNEQSLKRPLPTRDEVQQAQIEKLKLNELNLDNAKNVSAIKSNLKTPERLIESTFDKETAKKINDTIIYPIKDNEANSIRFKNKERAEIKELGIKPKSKESEAVQKLGENITSLDEIKKEFPNNWESIEKAERVLRSKYDNYIEMINDVITKYGYEAIPKRANYFRHFEAITSAIQELGLNNILSNLPTDINGLTAGFRPGKNFFANALKRTGDKTAYDAITGIDGYLDGAANLIYHTEDIQNLRSLDKYIRETYGQSALENIENLSDEQKSNLIDKVGKNHLSNFASWLTEYTNSIAGKTSNIDRGVESLLGRKGLNVANAMKTQVGANMVGFNIGSAATNLIAGVQGLAKTNKISFIKGTLQSVANVFKNDGFVDKSNFLTSRYGSERLSNTLVQKVRNVGGIAMEATDHFVANVIVRSKYNEYISKGFNKNEAMSKADDFARRVIGGRAKGDMPNLFNSKALGILSQFQLETLNQMDSIFTDTIKTDYASESNSKIAQNSPALYNAAFATFIMAQLMVFATLFNDEYEDVFGRRPAFDPIGVIKNAFKHLNNPELTRQEAMEKIVNETLQNIPFADVVVGGGRLPIASALPDISGIIKGETTLKKESIKIPTYLLSPTGGGQAKKTIEGLSMFSKPTTGSYTPKGQLRYPVEKTLPNMIQAGIAGQYASKEAREYFDNNKLPYSKEQTLLFNKQSGTGIEAKETIKFLQTVKQIENDKSLEGVDGAKTQKKAQYILSTYKNDAAKNNAFNYIFDKAQQENIRKAVVDYGIPKLVANEFYSTINNIPGDKDSTGKTITGSSMAKKATAIMNLDVSDANKSRLLDLSTTSDDPVTIEELNNVNKEEYQQYFAMAKSQRDKYQNLVKTGTNKSALIKFYNEIGEIEGKKDSSGKTILGSKKQAVFEYINSLPLKKVDKIMLFASQGYSVSQYKTDLFNYINKQKLTKTEKQAIWKSLGF